MAPFNLGTILVAVFGIFTPIDAYMGAVMGKITTCDDAKTNLEVDWNPKDFTVFTCPDKSSYPVRKDIQSFIFDKVAENKSYNPHYDQVRHKCMTGELIYDDIPPIRGDHRPNWGRFGEYLYIPPQRWLHNLEHGAIVMLYHPCANVDEVSHLRKILTGCIWRHVITPYNKLSPERPLALVGWGAKMEMAFVDEPNVIGFIKNFSRRAPEDINRDGLYDQYLVMPAKMVNDQMDNNVCDNYKP